MQMKLSSTAIEISIANDKYIALGNHLASFGKATAGVNKFTFDILA